jgi:hypothetical protein
MGNIMYWLGGSDEDCEGKFSWCELDQPLANWTKWAPNENNNAIISDNCLFVEHNVGLLKSDLRSAFRDDGHFKKKQFICEV